MRRSLLTASFFILCSAISVAHAQPRIDKKFGSIGSHGLVSQGFDLGANNADVGMAVESDSVGRLVMAGFAQNSNGVCLALVRFSEDGVLDTTAFGPDQGGEFTGKICYPTPVGPDAALLRVASLSLQPDNFSVVAGIATEANDAFVYVCRFDPKGRLDLGFGDISHPGCTRIPGVEPILGAPDPIVLVASDALALIVNSANGMGQPMVIRLSGVDGSIVPYGNFEAVALLANGAGSRIHDAIMVSDGEFIAVGETGGVNVQALVAKFNFSLGVHDFQFADNGALVVGYDFGDDRADRATAISLISEGYVIVGGASDRDTPAFFALFVHSDSADIDEVVLENPCSWEYGASQCMPNVTGVNVVQHGGIVLTGHHEGDGPTPGKLFAFGLKPDGSPDLSFGLDGAAIFDVPTGSVWSETAGAILQGDKIVVAGSMRKNEQPDLNFMMMRLLVDVSFRDGFE